MSDRSLSIIGFQNFFNHLRDGVFLFNHTCGTTLALDGDLLFARYSGTIYLNRKRQKSRDCPGICTTSNIHAPCSDQCWCSIINRIIHQHKKKRKGDGETQTR